MTASITAIVPSLNGGDLLERCIDSALAAPGVEELVLLDGGSTDGSPERAEARDRVRVLRRPDLGPMARINLGVAEAREELVLILNDDAFVDPETPARLAETMVATPDAGLVAAGLRSLDGSPQKCAGHFRTLGGELLFALGLARPAQGVLLPRAVRPREAGVDEVTWVPLCAVLARRAALDAIGGVDEDYGFYFEDEDVSRKLVSNGFGVYVRWDAGAIHVGGGNTRTRDPSRWFRRYQESRIRYLRVNYPRGWRAFAAAWAVRARVHALAWRLRAARHRRAGRAEEERRARDWESAFREAAHPFAS